MKIVALQAENVKKLVAVEIRPDGNLVTIAGRNGAGKTSILDSIWWALGGAGNIQGAPIRKGQSEARIRLDLGEVIVTRKFRKRADDTVDTSVIVESDKGARFPTPQRLLDSFLGALSFDPLAFARAEPAAQFEQLKRFVPDVDFAAIDGKNKTDFETRTDVNRREREARAAASQITVPDGTPAEAVDESGLVAQLEQAGEQNALLERRKAGRAQAQRDIEHQREEAGRLRDRAVDLRAQADAAEEDAKTADERADALQKKLDDAEPLPAPVDTAAVRTAIDNARRTNAAVAQRQQRDAHMKRAADFKSQSEQLTANIEKRKADRAAAISQAKLPVEGLGFGDGLVLFNGLPLDQASDAEQLRVSAAIAMAGNPKLRVIRIRDGSLLDESGMKLLADLADANDMQVWIERVDTTGKVGFVIEDGRLRDAPQEKEKAA